MILYLQLSTDSVGKLLCLTNQAIQRTLKDLHAILVILKNSSHLLRLHHPSFRDFFLDDRRCTNADLYVNEKQAHRQLYIKCIRLISDTLKQDICGLGAPDTVLADVAGSHVEQYLPPELQYACLYWVQHLHKSNSQISDNDNVCQFLQTHLLHWLEALSCMQKISEGIHAIISLEPITLVSLC